MFGPLLDALLLGVLHGVTWFFPVSSSGHLTLSVLLFGLHPWGLGVSLYAGTFIATIWVLRVRIGEVLLEGLRGALNPGRLRRTPGGQEALVVLIATALTALVFLVLRDKVVNLWSSPLAIGLGLLGTTLLLLSSQWVPRGQMEVPGWGVALLLGLGQGLALLPGVSRSAVTIVMLLWFGVKRERAFELSMLSSLPIGLSVVILELTAPSALPAFIAKLSPPGALGWGPAVLGGLAAAVTGVFALRALRRITVGEWFPWFALWVGPLAVATLTMARAWPGR